MLGSVSQSENVTYKPYVVCGCVKLHSKQTYRIDTTDIHNAVHCGASKSELYGVFVLLQRELNILSMFAWHHGLDGTLLKKRQRRLNGLFSPCLALYSTFKPDISFFSGLSCRSVSNVKFGVSVSVTLSAANLSICAKGHSSAAIWRLYQQ